MSSCDVGSLESVIIEVFPVLAFDSPSLYRFVLGMDESSQRTKYSIASVKEIYT
jgi:hypothetical protein